MQLADNENYSKIEHLLNIYNGKWSANYQQIKLCPTWYIPHIALSSIRVKGFNPSF